MRQQSLNRFVRGLRSLARRPSWLIVIGLGLLISSGLLVYGTLGTEEGLPNAALNVGTSTLGALITVAIIGPIIRYVQEGTVREHGNLDYGWFSDQVRDASREVQILTTFSNLMDHAAGDRFLRGRADRAWPAGPMWHPAAQSRFARGGPAPAGTGRRQRAAVVQREIMRNVRWLRTSRRS